MYFISHCVKSVSKSLYSVQIKENADQKKLRIGHFSRSVSGSINPKQKLLMVLFLTLVFWDFHCKETKWPQTILDKSQSNF